MSRPLNLFALAAALALTMAPPLIAATADGGWLRKIPASARTRVNPLNHDGEAPAAGARLFQHDCASCHGADALGRGSRPGLISDRVHNATDGELEWLLRNGSMAHGMPSWSKLPEEQRWQLVRYLRTLPVEKPEKPEH